jgi:hypothetical protein
MHKFWNKHATAFLLLFICLVCKVIAQPSINSFTPASGPVGSTVTINGSGFNANPSANIVFFGSARAEVISANSAVLTVKVPAGTTFEPITVTSNNLTGYSNRPFITTFTGGGIIRQQSFLVTAAADSVPNTIFETRELNFADFDGDGKTDAAVLDGRNDLVTIYKNTTSNKITSFATRQDFPTPHNPNAITTGDLDGDGRQDILITSESHAVSLYRNTSTAGSISFAPRMEIPIRTAVSEIKVGDLDGDGKPDVAMLTIDLDSINGLRSLVSILRNNSSSGVISFETQKDISLGFFTNGLCIANLDNDSKPEIVITSFASNRLLLLKNTSTAGQISFGAGPLLETGTTPMSLAIGDLDMDGKQDLVSANIEGTTVSLFRNLSAGGTLAFAPKFDLSAGVKVSDVEISDLDGDGKPDLAVTDLQRAMIVIRNRSVAGSFSFDSRVTFLTNFADDFSIADVNNDGQPDLGVISGFYRVLFWENKIGAPFITSFFPLEAASGDTIKINGTDLSNATSVMIGNQPALSSRVISPTLIEAVAGSTVSGNITVTTERGNHSKSGFVFKAPPIITGFNPVEGGAVKPITITGYNFTGTTAVKIGGMAAMSFQVVSPGLINATVNYGASSGSIEVTNRYGTATIGGFIFMPVPVVNWFTPLAAAAGATVTIYGKFLTTTTEVQIGGKPASAFTMINDSTVTAIVGAGTSGSVSVTTRGGTATKSGFNILPGITSFTPTAAAEGDTVTIYGTNLWAVNDVGFGAGRTYFVEDISYTIIKVKVESDATSGNVTLYSTYGSTSLPGFTFIPRPVITSISPVMGGKGTIMTITGRNFENVFSVTIGGVAPAKYTVVSPTSIIAELGDGASGAVTVKTRGGLSINVIPGGNTFQVFAYTTAPSINHFSPSAGAVGSEVTITGANFDPVAANNIVYFGPVRSKVNEATRNTLKVIVPAGAAYQRITVTARNLTAYSGKPFVVTFNGDTSVSTSTFADFTNFPTGKTPVHLTSADLDSDGKTDLIVANKGSNTISILRNISSNGEIKFAPKMDVVVAPGPYLVGAADIDGDAKPEILTFTDAGGRYMAQILPNTTNNGVISFADPVEWDAGWHPKDLAIADVDNDGKPDIAVINTNSKFAYNIYVTLFTNGSSPGNIIKKSSPWEINLTQPYTHVDDRLLNSIAVADLNEDGRVDIAVGYTEEYYKNHFTIYSKGQRSDLIDVEGTTYAYKRNVHMGDFDVDGKVDIIDQKNVFRYKDHFTFGYDRVDVIGDNSVIADINGDGKVDVLTLKPYAVSVFRNTSIPGASSFSSKTDFATGALTSSMIAGDFNGDGQPEIVVTNVNDNTISILKNQSGKGIIKICAGAGTAITSNTNGSTYQWQANDGNGFVNISDNSNYTGSSSNRLQLTNAPAAFNGLIFRCLVDGVSSDTSTLEVVSLRTPSISITSSVNNICSETPVTFTAVSANIGTAPVFKWFLNDVEVGYNENVYRAYLKNNNDKVKVQLTSNAGCLSNTIATSNVITTAVTPSVTPTAIISASTSNIICEGTPVTFTAVTTNGGDAPLYQWQLNGVNAGIIGTSFSASTLKNFDQVKFVLTSNAVCATKPVVNSNIITVTVSPKVVSKAQAPANLCYNNPYTVTYSSANAPIGSIVELWQSLNGSAFTRFGSKTYNGTALEFQFNSGGSNATNKYFFTVLPISTITCSGYPNSDTVMVETSTLLKPVISINVDSLKVTNFDAGASYYWQQMNGGSWTDLGSGTFGSSMKMYSTGSFRVRAEKGGCVEISEPLAIVVTGLPGLSANDARIRLHPNPTSRLLTIDSLLLSDKWETVEIMSAHATKALAAFNIRNKTSITIQLGHFPQGLYVAVLRRRNHKPVIIKFIKI